MFVSIPIPYTDKPPLGTPADALSLVAAQLSEFYGFNELGGALFCGVKKSTIRTLNALHTRFGESIKLQQTNVNGATPLGYGGSRFIQIGLTETPPDTITIPALNVGISAAGIRAISEYYNNAWPNHGTVLSVGSNGMVVTNFDGNAFLNRCFYTGDIKAGDSVGVGITGQTIYLYLNGLIVASNNIGGTDNWYAPCASLGASSVVNTYPFRGAVSYIAIKSVRPDNWLPISIHANPWQIYEPEIVWVEVGDGTATTYTETLTDLITSAASALDRQDYLVTADILIQSGVSATDVQTMLEAVLSVATTATSTTDAQAYADNIADTITGQATATDQQTYSDTINETIISATSATDSLVEANTFSETLLITATAITQIGDAQTFVDAVTAVAQTAASLAELRLLLDNVEILCQSQVSVTEIQTYLHDVLTTAQAQISLTEILVGVFVGRYLALEYARGRSFAESAPARSFAELAQPRVFMEYATPRGQV